MSPPLPCMPLPCRVSSPVAGSANKAPKSCAAPSTAMKIARTHEERPDFAEAIEHGRRQGISGLMALDFQQRAQRLKALALYLMRAQGRALRDLAPQRRHPRRTAGSTWKAASAPCSPTPAWARRELPSSQRAARRPGHGAGQDAAASPAPTSWCRAAAWRCTSTPSTSRSGACWKSSPRASWPACRASSSRPAPPAT